MTALAQKFPVQGREEPALDLLRIANLVALEEEHAKGFLSQVRGIAGAARQNESELVERLVELLDGPVVIHARRRRESGGGR